MMDFNFQKARDMMVDNQLKPNKIKDHVILNLFKYIKKEDFLSEEMKGITYSDLDINLDNNRKLQSIYSPGHAKHHFTFYDSETGTLFMGDTLGLIYPHGNLVQPNLPPPDFNKEILFNTYEKLLKLDLKQLAIAHFGIHNNPYDLINQAMDSINNWIDFCRDIENLSTNDAADKLKKWVKNNYQALNMDELTINNYLNQGQFEMQIDGIKNYLSNQN